MAISGYSIDGYNDYYINDYWWLLVVILLMAIDGYFRLNYHRLLMAIGGVILLMTVVGYFRLNYRMLLMVINRYWWLFY